MDEKMELKPCPICGEEAGIARPGCKGSLSAAGCWGAGHIAYCVGETREEAAAAWNAQIADVELERLREALRKIAAFDARDVPEWADQPEDEMRDIARTALGEKP